MSGFIPLSVPNLKGNELKYVSHAIEQEWVSTAGSYVSKFEENIAKYLKVPQAVACQSGTAGLHLALQLAGVTAEDAVIVPTLTFIAAVNPVKYLGAEPIFMDCEESLCMDMTKLECFCREKCELTEQGLYDKKSGKRIKAIVIVHVFGNMADMEALMKIASTYRLKVVEDATEALGSYYLSGKYAGKYAGTIGDFGVYSFNGNKIITTGGGGMMVAKNPEQLARAKHLSQQAKSDPIRFEHDEIGYNYRMTNLQAAMGVAQLEQLEQFIQIKKENYERYRQGIRQIPHLQIMPFRQDIRPNYWFYSLRVAKEFPLDRESLMREFSRYGIETRPIWGLIHLQKPYQGSSNDKVEAALCYREEILNLPCSSGLKAEEVEKVLSVLRTLGNR